MRSCSASTFDDLMFQWLELISGTALPANCWISEVTIAMESSGRLSCLQKRARVGLTGSEGHELPISK